MQSAAAVPLGSSARVAVNDELEGTPPSKALKAQVVPGPPSTPGNVKVATEVPGQGGGSVAAQASARRNSGMVLKLRLTYQKQS